MKEKVALEKCDDECAGSISEGAEMTKKAMITNEVAADLADTFKALGDSTRVKIIYALLQKELCVHDLTVLLDMGQSAISHQLRYLRNLRIVKRRKQGKMVFYSLDDHHIENLFSQGLNHMDHS